MQTVKGREIGDPYFIAEYSCIRKLSSMSSSTVQRVSWASIPGGRLLPSGERSFQLFADFLCEKVADLSMSGNSRGLFRQVDDWLRVPAARLLSDSLSLLPEYHLEYWQPAIPRRIRCTFLAL